MLNHFIPFIISHLNISCVWYNDAVIIWYSSNKMWIVLPVILWNKPTNSAAEGCVFLVMRDRSHPNSHKRWCIRWRRVNMKTFLTFLIHLTYFQRIIAVFDTWTTWGTKHSRKIILIDEEKWNQINNDLL